MLSFRRLFSEIKLLFLSTVCIFCTTPHVAANDHSLDESYKLRIVGNVGYKNILILEGDAAASLYDYNKCTPLDGCDYQLSFLFPDTYIGNTNFLYTFSVDAGEFDMNRQNVYFTSMGPNMSFKYGEVDLGTSISGEYLLFNTYVLYNFFRESSINLRLGLGIDVGRASLKGSYYLTDNKELTNTLNSKCWDYTHSNETFEDISNFCEKKSMNHDLRNWGPHFHLDIRFKYFGIFNDASVFGESVNSETSINFTKVVQGFYVLIPF